MPGLILPRLPRTSAPEMVLSYAELFVKLGRVIHESFKFQNVGGFSHWLCKLLKCRLTLQLK